MRLHRFEFKLLPLLGVLVALALFVSLGRWQAGKGERLQQELAARAARNELGAVPVGASLLDASALRDRTLVVRGEFEPQHQFFLDNRQHQGQPGLHVLTPLRIESSAVRILVNRGWVPWPSGGRGTLPVVSTPAGVQQISGQASVPSSKKAWLMPEQPDSPQLWTRLDLSRLASRVQAPVQTVVLQQTSDSADGLVRVWEPPPDKVAMHRGYAFQWFGMAVALLLFYLLASVRREARP